MTTQNRELASLIDSSGNVTATGNLTVSGTTTAVSSTNTTVTDPLIELNNGAGSNSNDLGFVFERGSTGDNACLIWDESNDAFAVGTTTATGTSTGNMSYTTGDFLAGKVTVDNVIINGTTIGHTDDTDLLTFADGALTVAGTIASTGVVTANAGVVVDNITIDGTEIDLSSGDLTLDVAGDIILDADGDGEIFLKDGGTSYGLFYNSNSNFMMYSPAQDKDIYFQGNDNGSTINALILDMSDAGSAYFNNKVGIGTSSPDTELHINGSANSEQVIITGNNNSGRGLSISTAASAGQQDAAVIFNAQDTENSAYPTLIYQTGGTERMRVKGTGEVHITTAGVAIDPTIKHGGATQDVSKLRLINRAGQAADKGGVLEMGAVTDDGVSRSDVLGSVGAFKTNATSGNREGYLQFSVSNGSALTERMRILSGGKVGIGTTSPANNLHIHTDNGDEGILIKSTGDTSNAIIIDANRGNAGAAINALTGKWNGTSVADILFLTGDDTTNKDDGEITFRTSSGVLTERMRIESGGTVVISNTSSTGLSNSNSNYGHSFGGGQQVNSTNNDLCLILNRSLGSGDMVAIRNNGSTVGSISQNGSNVTYGGTSDYRLKENVTDMTNATTRLKQLKPKRFNYISDTSDTLVDGFLAHEVSSLVPEAVVGNKDAVDSEGDPVWQMMDNSKLVPLLVKTIQELEARITTLEG